MISEEKYVDVINRLKKNREKVPLNDLKTKYAKAYNELLSQVKEETEARLNHFGLYGIRILKEDLDEMVPKIKQVINDSSDLKSEISIAAYQENDVDHIYEVIEKYNQRFMAIYIPYFQARCYKEDGKIHSKVLDAYDNTFIWEDNAWKNKDNQYMVFISPPEEMKNGA